MKRRNKILITFWLIKPEGDHHTAEQMRALGECGVYAPEFKTGERKIVVMESRFDPDDAAARLSALAYAHNNAKNTFSDGVIWGAEFFLNGIKVTEKIISP